MTLNYIHLSIYLQNDSLSRSKTLPDGKTLKDYSDDTAK